MLTLKSTMGDESTRWSRSRTLATTTRCSGRVRRAYRPSLSELSWGGEVHLYARDLTSPIRFEPFRWAKLQVTTMHQVVLKFELSMIPQCLQAGPGGEGGGGPGAPGPRESVTGDTSPKQPQEAHRFVAMHSRILAPSHFAPLTRSNPPTIPIITTGITSATRSGSRCITEGAPMGDLDQHLNHHPISP